MAYDQNPITFFIQLFMRVCFGDRTKSLKASRRPTCFAANNEGFGRNRCRNRVVKINKLLQRNLRLFKIIITKDLKFTSFKLTYIALISCDCLHAWLYMYTYPGFLWFPL